MTIMVKGTSSVNVKRAIIARNILYINKNNVFATFSVFNS